jgi:cyd operon protein YbgE
MTMPTSASRANGTAAHALSLLAAIALVALIVFYPRAVATSTQDIHHGRLLVMMWGISAGFVHGVGFVPRSRLLGFLLGPFAAWLLMGGSFLAMIVLAKGGLK